MMDEAIEAYTNSNFASYVLPAHVANRSESMSVASISMHSLDEGPRQSATETSDRSAPEPVLTMKTAAPRAL